MEDGRTMLFFNNGSAQICDEQEDEDHASTYFSAARVDSPYMGPQVNPLNRTPSPGIGAVQITTRGGTNISATSVASGGTNEHLTKIHLKKVEERQRHRGVNESTFLTNASEQPKEHFVFNDSFEFGNEPENLVLDGSITPADSLIRQPPKGPALATATATVQQKQSTSSDKDDEISMDTSGYNMNVDDMVHASFVPSTSSVSSGGPAPRVYSNSTSRLNLRNINSISTLVGSGNALPGLSAYGSSTQTHHQEHGKRSDGIADLSMARPATSSSVYRLAGNDTTPAPAPHHSDRQTAHKHHSNPSSAPYARSIVAPNSVKTPHISMAVLPSTITPSKGTKSLFSTPKSASSTHTSSSAGLPPRIGTAPSGGRPTVTR